MERWNVKIHILPANSGDCFLIEFNNDECIIIDMGFKDTYYKYLKPLLISLKNKGKKISLLVITHIDKDHIGGMQEILTNIKVGTLYMPYSTYEGKQFYTQLEEYIKENNINQQQIEKSLEKEYWLDNTTWKCLNVDNSNPSDKNKFNDTSIVIELEYGSTKYLFTGD